MATLASSFRGNYLHTKAIDKNLYQVELDTGGIKQLICSYVIAGSKPMLVESGPTSSVPNLLLGIAELGIKPETVELVAVTHVHLDHGGGAGTLLRHLPNAKVIVHPRGMPHLVNPKRLWASSQKVLGFISEIFGKPEPVAKERIIPKTEGSFDLGDGGKFTVVETLGHATHNLSFYESQNKGVFPGDAAGTYLPEFGVVVPTTPPPFHLESALASLDRLIGLEPDVLYFSHFGKADNAVQRLKDYKVQLQLWADIAVEGAEKNMSRQQIQDQIVAQDKALNKVSDFITSHPIYSLTVLGNCIDGFIEYAKAKAAE